MSAALGAMRKRGLSSFARDARRWLRAPLTLSLLSIGHMLLGLGFGVSDVGNRLVQIASDRLEKKGGGL